MDEDDVVRHPLGLPHHVRGEQDGPPLLLQFSEEVSYQHHVDGIEPRLRLVEDDELGVVQEGADELDLLLVALREFLDFGVFLLPELEPLQPLSDFLVDRRPPPPLDLRKKLQMLDDLHLLVEPTLLGQVPDPVTRVAAARPPRPLDDARVGQKDAGDHADGGGLPRPIPPEQPGDGPPPHGEGDPIHRPHGTKRLDYVPTRQNHGHAPPPRRRNRGVLYSGRGSGFGGIQDRIVEWQWNKDLHELMNDPIDLTYKPIA